MARVNSERIRKYKHAVETRQYKHVHDIDQVNISLKKPEHRRQEGEDRAHSSPAP